MPFLKNFDQLAKTPQRKIVLELVESALESIQPENVMSKNFVIEGNSLKIVHQDFDLSSFNRIVLIGFGKGSAGISKIIEEKLGDKLTEGYVIDLPANALPEMLRNSKQAGTHEALQAGTNTESFSRIHFTQGTHPLPSTINAAFTQALLKRTATLQLTEKDLVLVVICGGGSAMLVAPHGISLEKQIEVGKALLKSGADIIEMNTVRQHLSDVKGGGLAQALFPARVASLIFSDVPGNDLTYIASGPTAHIPTRIEDAKAIIKRYNLEQELQLSDDSFTENPQDPKYFQNVLNIIVLSNLTALKAMKNKASELKIDTSIISDHFEGEAKTTGSKLIEQASPNSILLAGGETTVKVTGEGKGGRNQEVVLGALENIDEKTIICSFDSDGWDNSEFAGAIGDINTKTKAEELQTNIQECLNSNDSFPFFEKVGDGIETGRLPSNVSDLFIVYKYV